MKTDDSMDESSEEGYLDDDYSIRPYTSAAPTRRNKPTERKVVPMSPPDRITFSQKPCWQDWFNCECISFRDEDYELVKVRMKTCSVAKEKDKKRKWKGLGNWVKKWLFCVS